ncbi:calcium-binding protein [Actinoplanes philippinensis]|uniref:Sugar lactone lactonase YvrE n=1 Tax=Actinoplanes philippinensis TaxID=35752 RepID=A0A1I2HIW9_9ACTN|nr:SMP-30/gluconolactonase/LRE family protein [Actinoplanes philippinensis]GIE82969.1 calcium-binding protein [Actinoplanes philippinensis]SFF29659.1 Sugar lactone lactonase YvrE [Actinoplanes philippinensis]
MIRRHTAQAATGSAHFLGEGPVWDPARQRLLWVDIMAGDVHEGRLAGGRIEPVRTWSFERSVGAVAVSAGGDLLVAERETLTRVHADGSRAPLARVLPAGSPGRLNDGAVDPSGRFLVGSLGTGREVLVRFEGGGCTTIDDDLTLSNGLAWSPSGDRFYSVDTLTRTVYVRDYPAGDRSVLFTVEDGHPDGLCVDAAGNLWLAIWGGGRVECRTPAGELVAVVEVDAPHTSSVAFAGPDLDVLVITTATQDMSAADLAAHPLSGRLFTAHVGVTGLLPAYWDPGL